MSLLGCKYTMNLMRLNKMRLNIYNWLNITKMRLNTKDMRLNRYKLTKYKWDETEKDIKGD